jgi:UDP-4-amino-4,6-dideoxy-N-acetyl-beta-L-altrosamine N-acetyltransferase
MKILKYGIELKKIESSDLELIRGWRNSDYVKKYMVFKDYITFGMQQNWFNKISNENNYYFVIITDGIAVGLASIKDIDNNLKIGESGIFMKSEEYTNSDIGVKATLALLDFAFLTLSLEKLFQTIKEANKSAKNFNKHLGVIITQTKNGVSYGYLSKQNYLLRTQKVRKFLNH